MQQVGFTRRTPVSVSASRLCRPGKVAVGTGHEPCRLQLLRSSPPSLDPRSGLDQARSAASTKQANIKELEKSLEGCRCVCVQVPVRACACLHIVHKWVLHWGSHIQHGLAPHSHNVISPSSCNHLLTNPDAQLTRYYHTGLCIWLKASCLRCAGARSSSSGRSWRRRSPLSGRPRRACLGPASGWRSSGAACCGVMLRRGKVQRCSLHSPLLCFSGSVNADAIRQAVVSMLHMQASSRA